jgi:hypothetical protein
MKICISLPPQKGSMKSPKIAKKKKKNRGAKIFNFKIGRPKLQIL